MERNNESKQLKYDDIGFKDVTWYTATPAMRDGTETFTHWTHSAKCNDVVYLDFKIRFRHFDANIAIHKIIYYISCIDESGNIFTEFVTANDYGYLGDEIINEKMTLDLSKCKKTNFYSEKKNVSKIGLVKIEVKTNKGIYTYNDNYYLFLEGNPTKQEKHNEIDKLAKNPQLRLKNKIDENREFINKIILLIVVNLIGFLINGKVTFIESIILSTCVLYPIALGIVWVKNRISYNKHDKNF